MSTNNNTLERVTKRRKLHKGPETTNKDEQKPSPKNADDPDIISTIRDIIETNKDDWSEKTQEVAESLAIYAHKDIKTKQVAHLKILGKIDKELNATRKLDDVEFIPKQIKIDDKIKGIELLTKDSSFEELTNKLKQTINNAQQAIKKIYQKARKRSVELLYNELQKQVVKDLQDVATVCSVIIKQKSDRITAPNEVLAQKAIDKIIDKLTYTDLPNSKAFLKHINIDDKTTTEARTTLKQHITRFAEPTNDELTEEEINNNERYNKVAINIATNITSKLAPLLTFQPYQERMKITEDRRIKKEVNIHIKNRIETEQTEQVEDIIIDNDEDKTEAIKNIVRQMTTAQTARIKTLENQLKNKSKELTNNKSKKSKQRETAKPKPNTKPKKQQEKQVRFNKQHPQKRNSQDDTNKGDKRGYRKPSKTSRPSNKNTSRRPTTQPRRR